jgi:hypothetical protein
MLTLCGVCVTLEIQYQMRSFSPIAVDLVQSWQVRPYCFHHQLNFVGNLLLVCLKHPWSPKISNQFDQQNAI